MSMTIVPGMCRILIVAFFGIFLPPAFLKGLLGTFVWPVSRGGSPIVGASEVWAVSFDMESIAFLAEGSGEVAGISGSGFQCFWNCNWFSVGSVFFWLWASAGASIVIVSSHGPKYVIILKRVFAVLTEFLLIASLWGWYW